MTVKDMAKALRKERDFLLKKKQKSLDWALDKGSEDYGSLHRDTLNTLLHSYHRIIKDLEDE